MGKRVFPIEPGTCRFNRRTQDAITLRRWRRDSRLTWAAAATDLGISEPILAYYEAAERDVPSAILLAVLALEFGLRANGAQNRQMRNRWVTLVAV